VVSGVVAAPQWLQNRGTDDDADVPDAAVPTLAAEAAGEHDGAPSALHSV